MPPLRPSLLLVCTLLGSHGVQDGRIRRVPAEYPTVQAAIDSSTPGDTVLVSPGRYQENIRFDGKGIIVASEYLLRHDPAFITRTILDGGHPRHPDSASVVMFVGQEDTSAELIGFTITGGRGTVWTDARDKTLFREGGGTLCELCAPRIEHNIIEDNEAVSVVQGVVSAGGGGIRCGYAEPVIQQRDQAEPRALWGRNSPLPFGRDRSEQSDRCE